MALYYRLTAYNRANLDSTSRADDIATVIHYGATEARRVSNAVFTEEKNSIPSLQFRIYPNNPGYDALVEFDTLIILEEMTDTLVSEISSYGVVVIHSAEELLEYYDTSGAYVDASTLVMPDYGEILVRTDSAGIILDGYVLAIQGLRTTTTIPTSVRIIFDGRVLKVSVSLDSDGVYYKDVICEGALGFLCDSVQPYLEEQTWEDTADSTGLMKYMSHLLDMHNSQVEDHKKIFISVCDTTTNLTNTQVTKGTNWQSTWDVISEKLIKIFGGEIQVKRGSDGLLYLYYTDNISNLNVVEDSPQVIYQGTNLISGSNEPQVTQVITRLYPLGCKLEDADGNETEERLTIETASKSGGLAYIEDASAIKRYGVVAATNIWNDVTTVDALYSKAVDWLASNNNFPTSLTLSAYDISSFSEERFGERFARLELYGIVNIGAEVIGTETMPLEYGTMAEIIKRTVNLGEPWLSTLEFGEVARTASAQYAELSAQLNELNS